MYYQGTEVSLPVEYIEHSRFPHQVSDYGRGQTDILEMGSFIRRQLETFGFAFVRIPELSYNTENSLDAIRKELSGISEHENSNRPRALKWENDQCVETINDASRTWSAFPRLANYSKSLLGIAHGQWIAEIASSILGGYAVEDPNIYVRATSHGVGTHLHIDYPDNPPPNWKGITFWLALSDIEPAMGSLFFPVRRNENFDKAGHLWYEKPSPYLRRNSKHLPLDPRHSTENTYDRLLTFHAQLGDLIVFGATQPHGSFDNTDDNRRLRLSLDWRWATT